MTSCGCWLVVLLSCCAVVCCRTAVVSSCCSGVAAAVPQGFPEIQAAGTAASLRADITNLRWNGARPPQSTQCCAVTIDRPASERKHNSSTTTQQQHSTTATHASPVHSALCSHCRPLTVDLISPDDHLSRPENLCAYLTVHSSAHCVAAVDPQRDDSTELGDGAIDSATD